MDSNHACGVQSAVSYLIDDEGSAAAEWRVPAAVQRTSVDQEGAAGVICSGIHASSGVRSPLRWLQPPQAATVFSQVFLLPRERGSM
jgi:hypothetical protein